MYLAKSLNPYYTRRPALKEKGTQGFVRRFPFGTKLDVKLIANSKVRNSETSTIRFNERRLNGAMRSINRRTHPDDHTD